jgi:hypothetical protein
MIQHNIFMQVPVSSAWLRKVAEKIVFPFSQLLFVLGHPRSFGAIDTLWPMKGLYSKKVITSRNYTYDLS